MSFIFNNTSAVRALGILFWSFVFVSVFPLELGGLLTQFLLVTSAGVKGIFLGYLLPLGHPLCVLGGGGQGAETTGPECLYVTGWWSGRHGLHCYRCCQRFQLPASTLVGRWELGWPGRHCSAPGSSDHLLVVKGEGGGLFFPSPLGRLNRVFLFVFVVFVWLCLG